MIILLVLYALASLLFAMFILHVADRTFPSQAVAYAAAVMLIWPILAITYIVLETIRLLGVAEEEEEQA